MEFLHRDFSQKSNFPKQELVDGDEIKPKVKSMIRALKPIKSLAPSPCQSFFELFDSDDNLEKNLGSRKDKTPDSDDC